jgi:hypothetical protein
MSLETDLYAVLSTVCPRVFPDVAPATTATPYITWQQIGGTAFNYVEGTLPDTRNARIQINVWDKSRMASNAMIQQVEQALCAAPAFQCRVESAHLATIDDDTDLRGAMQDFSVWADR